MANTVIANLAGPFTFIHLFPALTGRATMWVLIVVSGDRKRKFSPLGITRRRHVDCDMIQISSLQS